MSFPELDQLKSILAGGFKCGNGCLAESFYDKAPVEWVQGLNRLYQVPAAFHIYVEKVSRIHFTQCDLLPTLWVGSGHCWAILLMSEELGEGGKNSHGQWGNWSSGVLGRYTAGFH